MSGSFGPGAFVGAIAHGNPVAPTDRSGATAAPGTAQAVMPANPRRRGLWLQNLSGADLWLSALGPATAGPPSLRLPPGALYEAPAHGVPAGEVSVLGGAAGQAFAAREW